MDDERDDDYSEETWKERFIREHPDWTEEEIQSYFDQLENESAK